MLLSKNESIKYQFEYVLNWNDYYIIIEGDGDDADDSQHVNKTNRTSIKGFVQG